MHHLLFYDYVADMAERRTPYREDHLRLAREAASRGELLLAGALADPIDGAVFVFSTEAPATVERFVAGDPYVRAGLVTAWRIRRWQVVVDASAEPAA
jgi:uncharacterized protein YciI